MSTKLTLTIDASVIEKAKIYTQKKGSSISKLVENYLRIITNDIPPKAQTISPFVKSLQGTFQVDENFDYKDELSKALSGKYS
jgi:hypothetical protein